MPPTLPEKARRVKFLLLLLLGLPGIVPASPPPASEAVTLTLHGTTLTLEAREASLYDILAAFAAYGISVDVMPGIDARFNGTLADVRIDDALERILGHHPHNTTWRELPFGPGHLRILSGIQVHAPGGGGADPLRPIPAGPRRIRHLPTGEAYLADELLLGMRPGSDLIRFRQLLAGVGGQVIAVDPVTGIYRVRLPQDTDVPAILARLAENDLVAVSEPNFVYPVHTPEAEIRRAPSDTESRIALSPPATGHPALAIIDSGVDPTQLPAEILRASRDMTGAGLPLEDPVGHGTHMALIAAGLSGTPGHEAPGTPVPLVSIRGFDPDGNTHSFRLLESLAFAAESGARVVSMSWGSHTESAILAHAFRLAADQGMILLASAGNDGESRLMFPAAYPAVLAVGAAAPDGTREPYSNHGPGLDLLAPGTAVLQRGDTQTLLRGTSMATPWVAAALTVWLDQNPEADAAEALDRLRDSLLRAPQSGNEEPGLFNEAARAQFLGQGVSDQ